MFGKYFTEIFSYEKATASYITTTKLSNYVFCISYLDSCSKLLEVVLEYIVLLEIFLRHNFPHDEIDGSDFVATTV